MVRATLEELHADTNGLVKRAADGEVVIIEQDGEAVARLEPVRRPRQTKPMPDRELFFRSLGTDAMDSGRILEEDRS